MLLVFYAVANLNVVTWGTRDVNKASSGKQEKSTLQRFQGGIMRMVSMTGGQDMRTGCDDDVTSDYTFSFGNLFRLACLLSAFFLSLSLSLCLSLSLSLSFSFHIKNHLV